MVRLVINTPQKLQRLYTLFLFDVSVKW